MIPARLMPHTVTIEAFKGTGAYGDTFDPPVSYPARVDWTRRLVRTGPATESVSEATVLLKPDVRCPAKSLIKLPGETEGRRVYTFSPIMEARAVHHVEVTTS